MAVSGLGQQFLFCFFILFFNLHPSLSLPGCKSTDQLASLWQWKKHLEQMHPTRKYPPSSFAEKKTRTREKYGSTMESHIYSYLIYLGISFSDKDLVILYVLPSVRSRLMSHQICPSHFVDIRKFLVRLFHSVSHKFYRVTLMLQEWDPSPCLVTYVM